jgi:hypothetical protein
MGEAKRRRVLQLEQKSVSLADIDMSTVVCGWRDCWAIAPRGTPGWAWLVSYNDADPKLDTRQIERWRHDVALCPQHAPSLDNLLINISVLDDTKGCA